jgi:CheY-like chemotaxis protein
MPRADRPEELDSFIIEEELDVTASAGADEEPSILGLDDLLGDAPSAPLGGHAAGSMPAPPRGPDDPFGSVVAPGALPRPGTRVLLAGAAAAAYAPAVERAGCAVVVASSGVDALASLDGASPDLVITTLELGDLSGIEMMKAAQALHPRIQFLVVDDPSFPQQVVAALGDGAVAFIPAGSAPERLVAALARATRAPGSTPPAPMPLPPPPPPRSASAPPPPPAPLPPPAPVAAPAVLGLPLNAQSPFGKTPARVSSLPAPFDPFGPATSRTHAPHPAPGPLVAAQPLQLQTPFGNILTPAPFSQPATFPARPPAGAASPSGRTPVEQDREVNALKARMAEVERERDALRTQLAGSENDRNSLKTQLASAERERDGLRSRATEAGGAERELAAQRQKVAELEQELAHQRGGALGLQQSVGAEQARAAEAQRENAQLKQRLAVAEAEVIPMEARIGQLEAEVAEARGRTSQMESVLASERGRAQALEQEANALRAQQGAMQAEGGAAKSRLDGLAAELAYERAQHHAAAEARATLETRLSSADNQRTQLQSQMGQLQAQLAQVQASLAQAQAELAQRPAVDPGALAALQDRGAQAEARVAQLEADLAQTRHRASAADVLQMETMQLKSRAAQLEGDLMVARSAEGRAAGAEARANVLEGVRSQLESEAASLRGRLQQLEGELQTARNAEKRVVAADQARTQAEASLKDAWAEVDQVKGDLRRVQMDLIQARNSSGPGPGAASPEAIKEAVDRAVGDIRRLVEAVSPLTWGVEQALEFLDRNTQGSEKDAHVRQLRLLLKVLQKLKDKAEGKT